MHRHRELIRLLRLRESINHHRFALQRELHCQAILDIECQLIVTWKDGQIAVHVRAGDRAER